MKEYAVKKALEFGAYRASIIDAKSIVLAKAAGMKYINGSNTVTYFGAVLFSLNGGNR